MPRWCCSGCCPGPEVERCGAGDGRRAALRGPYASVTALRAGGYTSVAVSGEIARAVDEVQYADRAGPCVDAISEAVPVAVPDIAVVLVWPGFRQAAVTMGLRVSLSIPLFAGSGVPVASLNLYSRDEAAMAALTCGVYAAFGTSPPAVDGGLVPGVLDAGGQERIRWIRTQWSTRVPRTVIGHHGCCTTRGHYPSSHTGLMDTGDLEHACRATSRKCAGQAVVRTASGL